MTTQTRLLAVSILALAAFASLPAEAQVGQATKASGGSQSLVDRGKYIVEGVAMCELCHTQRNEHGDPEQANWLMGGPAQLRPAYPSPNWAQREPRIAGTPPGTDAEFIKLLTTGISRTGRPPNPPMPPFRMSQEDAQAVLAYLKTLRR